ncbi:universal stress protein [Nocardioides sambongensis]|uniref:universal stress protein n=1 Tax=Nocardioides sambongensis TaxID=2589074 RepID=UPI00112E543C|nr:universal stress protein [Nocardioides sambongensis]
MTIQIVTGVDRTETALTAARRAVQLASALDGDLHVISAYGKADAEVIEEGSEEFVVSNEQSGLALAQEVVLTLQRETPEVRITAAAAGGKPAEALVRIAEHLGADLIVIGNRRVQGPARVLGSVARDVAAHAPCDVYIVHTTGR